MFHLLVAFNIKDKESKKIQREIGLKIDIIEKTLENSLIRKILI